MPKDNLLKRHVLKRCIYGVDLNPMAVELAKVSLWLDAFTLGAPLSFLDHHLRCGNSLIGASFDDLHQLTSGSLFAINYEPMLRAIRNVLLVSRLSDTTAAEVHESANKYDAARKDLDGYRLVLDLIVAQHFGVAKAASLITDAHDLRLDSRKRFLESLGEKDAALANKVDDTSKKRRFFHWELEFPEVYFHHVDGSKQLVQKKSEDDRGFHCVIGNPPWGADTDDDEKRYIENFFFSGKSRSIDIYALIFERSLRVGSHGSHLGLITPDTFLRKDDYEQLRKLILKKTTVIELAETGPLFDEVQDTWCCITQLRNGLDESIVESRHLKLSRFIISVQERLQAFRDCKWSRQDLINQQVWLSRLAAKFGYRSSFNEQRLIERMASHRMLETVIGFRISRGEEGSKASFRQLENGKFCLVLPEDVERHKVTTGLPISPDALAPGKVRDIYTHPKIWIIRIQKLRWYNRIVAGLDLRANSAAMKTCQSITSINDNVRDLQVLHLILVSDLMNFWCVDCLSDDMNAAYLGRIPLPLRNDERDFSDKRFNRLVKIAEAWTVSGESVPPVEAEDAICELYGLNSADRNLVRTHLATELNEQLVVRRDRG